MDWDKIGSFEKDEIRSLVTKYRSIIKGFQTLTDRFPQTENLSGLRYQHFGLPRAALFLDVDPIPIAIRRMCIQEVIDRARYLTDIRPYSKRQMRVIAEISLPKLSDSGIIVFLDHERFKEFFEKDLNNSTAIQMLSECRSIEKEWIVCIPDGFTVVGMQEEIKDSEYVYQRELWYIGELY